MHSFIQTFITLAFSALAFIMQSYLIQSIYNWFIAPNLHTAIIKVSTVMFVLVAYNVAKTKLSGDAKEGDFEDVVSAYTSNILAFGLTLFVCWLVA